MSDTPKKLGFDVAWPEGADTRFLEGAAQDPDLASPDLRFRADFAAYGDRLKALRKSQNLTQTQLANLTGLTQARISAIESSTMEDGPTFKTMSRIADALGTSDLSLAKASAPMPVKVMADVGLFSQTTAAVTEVVKKAMSMRDHFTTIKYAEQPMVLHVSNKGGTGYEVHAVKGGATATWSKPDLVEIAGLAERVNVVADVKGVKVMNATPNYIVPSDDPNAPPATINVRKDV